MCVGGGGDGGGGGHPDPEVRGGRSQKNCFSALQASFWSKNKEGAVLRAPSLDPPLCGHVTSRHGHVLV